jgi:hypothetical protein
MKFKIIKINQMSKKKVKKIISVRLKQLKFEFESKHNSFEKMQDEHQKQMDKQLAVIEELYMFLDEI